MTLPKPITDFSIFADRVDRFWQKVMRSDDSADTCWHWIGRTNNGYGYMRIRQRWYQAHRVSWILHYGTITNGLVIDHLCRNRACVNPAHLEEVTVQVNTMRGYGFAAKLARQTHCKHGHPFTPENTHVQPPPRYRRICRTCARASGSRYYARKRAALKAKEYGRHDAAPC